MRKILSVLLCAALLLLCMPVDAIPVAQAVTAEYTEGYYTYTVTEGEAAITAVGRRISGAVTIPSKLGGYPVTVIREYAFWNCPSLTSVTIPDGVTAIGYGAFEDCTSLETVQFNASNCVLMGAVYFIPVFKGCSALTTAIIGGQVQTVPSYLFYDCTSLTSVIISDGVTGIELCAFWNCTSLTSVTLPDSMTIIGGNAFENCTSLTSVTLPDGMTLIRNYAFNKCSSLVSVTIPDSVTTISISAFSDCTALTSVTIPESVTQIDVNAFFGCTSLKSVQFNAAYCTYMGSSSKPVFDKCSALTTVSFGDKVQAIPAYAFYNCTSLASVDIPNSVTRIGEHAFLGCAALEMITIPESVQSISEGAFENCTSLETVQFNAIDCVYMGGIGGFVFKGCSALTAVNFGRQVKTIPAYAFRECTALKSVTLPDSVTSIGRYAFYNTAQYNDSANWMNGALYIGNHLIDANASLPKNYTIWSGTKTIADSAFSGCTSLVSVTIPGSVTDIGNSAFYGCTSLKSVQFNADRCTSMGSSAGPVFEKCSALTTVSFGEKVQLIPAYAFYNCTSLVSVFFPKSLTAIGRYAFYNCTSLISKTCCGTIDYISIDSGNEVLIDENWNYHQWQSATCVVPKTCSICGKTEGFALGHKWQGSDCTTSQTCMVCGAVRPAFEHDWKGATCAAPKTCSICNKTEGECGDHIVNGTSLCQICKKQVWFYGGNNGQTVLMGGLTTIEGELPIPETLNGNSITAITAEAFKGRTDIRRIVIPSSIRYISKSAFEGCVALEEVVFLGEGLLEVESDAFRNCPNLKTMIALSASSYTLRQRTVSNLSLPGTVTAIGEGAFADCALLVEFVLPNSVTTMGSGVFSGCTALQSVTLSAGMTILPQNLFQSCTALVQVTIPEGVKNVEAGAFDGCTKLITVTIPTTVTTISSTAFSGSSVSSVLGAPGSAAESFATGNGLTFGCSHDWGGGNCLWCSLLHGDTDGDGCLSVEDAVYLLYHTMLPEMYPLTQGSDMNRNGTVDGDDAIYLLYYCLLPDLYPL